MLRRFPPHQFCLKHQRWVKSILQECPNKLQTSVSSSPELFLSSLSTSSSQNLTPSVLMPSLPEQHAPSQTRLQTAASAPAQANLEDNQSSGSANDPSQMEPVPQPSLSRDTFLPDLLSPVVQLVDIASVIRSYPTCKPHQTSPHNFTMSANKEVASAPLSQGLTSPHCHTSTFSQP